MVLDVRKQRRIDKEIIGFELVMSQLTRHLPRDKDKYKGHTPSLRDDASHDIHLQIIPLTSPIDTCLAIG